MCLRLSYAPAVCNFTKKRSDKKDTSYFQKTSCEIFHSNTFSETLWRKDLFELVFLPICSIKRPVLLEIIQKNAINN